MKCHSVIVHLVTLLVLLLSNMAIIIHNLACITTPQYDNYNPNCFVSLEPYFFLAAASSVLAWVFTNTLLACFVSGVVMGGF